MPNLSCRYVYKLLDTNSVGAKPDSPAKCASRIFLIIRLRARCPQRLFFLNNNALTPRRCEARLAQFGITCRILSHRNTHKHWITSRRCLGTPRPKCGTYILNFIVVPSVENYFSAFLDRIVVPTVQTATSLMFCYSRYCVKKLTNVHNISLSLWARGKCWRIALVWGLAHFSI